VLSPVTAARTILALACVALPVAAGCGKKGPPLAPLSRLPVAPLQVSAARAGNEVTIRFVVPNANVSRVRPADIERVDVYAWTGPPLKPAEVYKLAKVVASVPVRPPSPPEDETDENAPPPPPEAPRTRARGSCARPRGGACARQSRATARLVH